MPARAPASIDMLHTVSRPSIDRPRIVLPAYSMTWPTPPAAPIRAMIASTTSLAPTPAPSAPSTVMRIARGLRCHRHWVAITCVTSEAPMPKASAPSAPCVAVCESPQTSVIPGWVRPCSGLTTCAMPWRASSIKKKRSMPASRVFSRICSTCPRCCGSGIASSVRAAVEV